MCKKEKRQTFIYCQKCRKYVLRNEIKLEIGYKGRHKTIVKCPICGKILVNGE